MRAQEFLSEYRESHLYHGTTWYQALRIWREGMFRPDTSFTRMWTYAAGYVQGMNRPQEGWVIFALDADRLRREFGRRNLQGYDWFTDNDPSDAEYRRRNWHDDTDRAEERNRRPIPLDRYLTGVQVWMPVKPRRRPDAPALVPGPEFDLDQAYSYEPDAGIAAALKDPENQRVWSDMQRDPRVQIMPDNRMPGRQQGVRIPSRRQYDRQHPAHLSQR